MKYLKIPNTDLTVSAVCMGTGEIGSRVSREDSFRLFDIMFENGGNFIDTAKVYGDWDQTAPKSISERIVGEWVLDRGVRKSIVLATKGCITANNRTEDNNSKPETIERHIDWSLNTLEVDCIDLWYIHKDDQMTPVDEIMDCLHDQVALGKIRYYGVSNMLLDRMKQALDYTKAKEIPNFCVDQSLWNAAVLAKYPYNDRYSTFMNNSRYDFHKMSGMAFCAYQSTAYGLFHRLFNGTLANMNTGFREFYDERATITRYERILEVMLQKDISLTEVVLAYIYCQPDFVCIPIVGSYKAEQVLQNFRAGNTNLTKEDLSYIEGSEKFGWR